MSAILTTSRLNDIMASCLGLSANILLLWFMFTSNKVELKPVTKILTQNCVIDMCLAIAAFLSQPVSFQLSIPSDSRFTGHDSDTASGVGVASTLVAMGLRRSKKTGPGLKCSAQTCCSVAEYD